MSELRFDDRVAIVTGAGNGLGRAYAHLLAARGARVLVNDLGGDVIGRGGSSAAADAVVAEIEAAGGQAAANAESVATSEGGRAIVADAVARWGRLDIVVNNAGIAGRPCAFEDLPDDQIDAVVGTHLLGAFHVLRPAWREMKQRGYGRVVNTSSATGLGVDGTFDYPAAKMGILGLSRSLALHGAAHDIKVNVVMPLAYTRMAAGVPDEQIRGWLEQTFPVDKVAPLVAYLCHEEAPITGEIFSVGGGRAARVTTCVVPGNKVADPTPESLRDAWGEVMEGGDPQIALDGSVDAQLMDDGFAAIGRASVAGEP